MEAAATKRTKAKTDVGSWLQEANQLLQDKADEAAINRVLTRINEAMDIFTDSQLDYVSQMDTEEKKDAEKAFHEDLANEVRITTESIAKYLKKDGEEPQHGESASKAGSVRSNRSSTSSARVKAATKKAMLIAEAQMMERKHQLELAEKKLKQDQERLRLDTEIAKADAEEKVLSELEAEDDTSHTQRSRVDKKSKVIEDERSQLTEDRKSQTTEDKEVILNFKDSPQAFDFCEQQKKLIDMMQAPKVEIPFFDGNPLQYYVFIRAFEENVERIM